MIQPTITFIRDDSPRLVVTAELGDGLVDLQLTGGWNTVQRPKSVSITEWQGYDPDQLVLPIMFDGFARNRSVEASVNALRRMMRDKVGSRKQPGTIRFESPLPLPGKTMRWVMTDATLSDQIRRPEDGHLVRAVMSVTLLQYVAGDVIVHHVSSPAKAWTARSITGSGGSVGRVTYYTVRQGDTLPAIAARLLGNSKYWVDIASLNRISGSNLKVGQRLRIPDAAYIAEHPVSSGGSSHTPGSRIGFE